MQNIVGIKYIGKKDSQEDSICNTGAIWLPDEVINFSQDMAKKLTVHTDSFLEVEFDEAAKTYSSEKKVSIQPVLEFKNIAGMGADELVGFARSEFNKAVVVDGRSVEDLRAEVLGYLSARNLNLNDEFPLIQVDKNTISIVVTDDEYNRYVSKELALVLVPVAPVETKGKDLGVAGVAPSDNEVATNEQLDAAEAKQDGKLDENLPTLTELLASLSTKKELQAFAKENNVTYANSMNETQLRAKLLRELNK